MPLFELRTYKRFAAGSAWLAHAETFEAPDATAAITEAHRRAKALASRHFCALSDAEGRELVVYER